MNKTLTDLHLHPLSAVSCNVKVVNRGLYYHRDHSNTNRIRRQSAQSVIQQMTHIKIKAVYVMACEMHLS